ncbi:hypothetical protein M885DRAFT_513491 [Pelagophyceae sp. CCMP2097]|nr:hypothetical protein M885DRAFT_513491 [Pelagophyceae sp. CCMP2097]
MFALLLAALCSAAFRGVACLSLARTRRLTTRTVRRSALLAGAAGGTEEEVDVSFSESTARFEADRMMKDTAVRELRQLEAEALAQMSAKEKEIMRKTNTAMMYLRMGQFEDALVSFDAARALAGPAAYLWQRGIALFYLGRYGEAAADFDGNADIFEEKFEQLASEERVLAACARRKAGDETALVLNPELEETRPVLSVVNAVFSGSAAMTDVGRLVINANEEDRKPGMRRRLHGHFYAALYFESVCGDDSRARAHMVLANERALAEQAKWESDVTLVLPSLHLKARGWEMGQVSETELERARAFA